MLDPMVVTWAGIHQHMGGQELVFHLRAIDISKSQIDKIRRWSTARNITLHVYDYSGIDLQGKATFNVPESVTVRLVPLQDLHDVGNRLLFLDADLIILDDLRPLFEMSLNGRSCAACVDGGIGRHPRNLTLGLPPNAAYFNAGVMLIDVASWMQNRISERALQFMQQNAGLCAFADQDALNVTLCENYTPLDERYNRFTLLEKSTQDWDAGRWAVVHFAGQPKPWNLKKLKPRHLERAGYFWNLARLGLSPGKALLVTLSLRLQDLFHRAVAGTFATLSLWRQRITPARLEEQYCRLRFVLTRGKWK